MKIGFYKIIEGILQRWDNETEKFMMLDVLTRLDNKNIPISGPSFVSFIGAMLKYSNKKLTYDEILSKVENVYSVKITHTTMRGYLKQIIGGLDGEKQ